MQTCLIWSLCLAATVVSALPSLRGINSTEKRITHGHDVDIWNAKYYTFFTCDGVVCGATLVSNTRVITAAHCVPNCKPEKVKMFFGMNSRAEIGGATSYGATNVISHPQYTSGVDFDIAVIYVNGRVLTNDRIGPIGYGTSFPPIHSYVYKVGYGLKENQQEAQKLQGTWLWVLEYKNHVMINDAEQTSACAGDSGGPVVYDNKLVGVTSHVGVVNGESCRSRNYDVAIPHPDILNFVRSHVG